MLCRAWKLWLEDELNELEELELKLELEDEKDELEQELELEKDDDEQDEELENDDDELQDELEENEDEELLQELEDELEVRTSSTSTSDTLSGKSPLLLKSSLTRIS